MSSFTTPLQYKPHNTLYHGRPTYEITEEFEYCFGSLENPLATFKVPVGFVTDFASIPWPFRLIFHPDGPWAKAAVLHDWLITNQLDISKPVQDSIFYEAMGVLKISKFISWSFFTAVRFYREVLGH